MSDAGHDPLAQIVVPSQKFPREATRPARPPSPTSPRTSFWLRHCGEFAAGGGPPRFQFVPLVSPSAGPELIEEKSKEEGVDRFVHEGGSVAVAVKGILTEAARPGDDAPSRRAWNVHYIFPATRQWVVVAASMQELLRARREHLSNAEGDPLVHEFPFDALASNAKVFPHVSPRDLAKVLLFRDSSAERQVVVADEEQTVEQFLEKFTSEFDCF